MIPSSGCFDDPGAARHGPPRPAAAGADAALRAAAQRCHSAVRRRASWQGERLLSSLPRERSTASRRRGLGGVAGAVRGVLSGSGLLPAREVKERQQAEARSPCRRSPSSAPVQSGLAAIRTLAGAGLDLVCLRRRARDRRQLGLSGHHRSWPASTRRRTSSSRVAVAIFRFPRCRTDFPPHRRSLSRITPPLRPRALRLQYGHAAPIAGDRWQAHDRGLPDGPNGEEEFDRLRRLLRPSLGSARA